MFFEIKGKYAVERSMFDYDYTRFTPESKINKDAPNSPTFKEIPTEDSIFPSKVEFFELDYRVTHKAGDHDETVNAVDVRLNNVALYALFSV